MPYRETRSSRSSVAEPVSFRPDRNDLFRDWRSLPEIISKEDQKRLADMARSALDIAEPLLALDICRRGLSSPTSDPTSDLQLQRLEALALARSGAYASAHRAMQRLIDQQTNIGGIVDSESLGILARTYKDLWARSPEAAQRHALLDQALQHYKIAYFGSKRIWAGVNVALLSLISGHGTDAERFANEVLTQIAFGTTEDHDWTSLSEAECHLILRNLRGAKERYQAAIDRGTPLGRLASARRNAQFAAIALGLTDADLEEIFPATQVVVFAGHRIDAANRANRRFPRDAESIVEEAIENDLQARGPVVGIGSLADGSDILFHEATLALGGESHVVLPSPPDVFIKSSVTYDARGWRPRFEQILSRATSVTVLSPEAGEAIDFAYANQVVLGLAHLRASQYCGHLRGLCVWDRTPGLPGGTATAVTAWRKRRVPVSIIDPMHGSCTRADNTLTSLPAPALPHTHVIAALLFADAQGFSNLSRDQVAAFTEQVLGSVAKRLDELGSCVLCRNSWGDALYVAFSNLQVARQFADELVKLATEESCAAQSLPNISFRVSLHAGPVREIFDPITKSRNFVGPHVSWAARIEPITPPGVVYMSEPFAALSSLSEDSSTEYVFVGHLPLAKGYGVRPLYSTSIVETPTK